MIFIKKIFRITLTLEIDWLLQNCVIKVIIKSRQVLVLARILFHKKVILPKCSIYFYLLLFGYTLVACRSAIRMFTFELLITVITKSNL